MTNVKLAVIYYSSTGTNYNMALAAAEGAKELGADVKILKVAELAPAEVIESNPEWKAHVEATKDIPVATPEDLVWADAIIFSIPTRFGNMPSQMKQFLDITGGVWAQGKLANKVVSAMTSAGNAHGGQEATILSLYTSMFHWGAIVAAPGFTDPSIYGAGGNPYGASVLAQGKDGAVTEAEIAAIKHQAKRTVSIAEWVKKGNQ